MKTQTSGRRDAVVILHWLPVHVIILKIYKREKKGTILFYSKPQKQVIVKAFPLHQQTEKHWRGQKRFA